MCDLVFRELRSGGSYACKWRLPHNGERLASRYAVWFCSAEALHRAFKCLIRALDLARCGIHELCISLQHFREVSECGFHALILCHKSVLGLAFPYIV